MSERVLPKRSLVVFLTVLGCALIVQTFLWINVEFVDRDIWVPAVEKFATGAPVVASDPQFGYPALSILMPGSVLVRLGVSPWLATRLVISISVSLLISCIVLVLYVLGLGRGWWLGAAGLLIFNRLYTEATPPMAIFSLLFVLTVFLILLIYKRREYQLQLTVLLALCNGFVIITRLDMSLFLLAAEVVFLWPRLKYYTLVLVGWALLFFVMVDTHMWWQPVQYFKDIYDKVHIHYAVKQTDQSLWDILRMSPMSSLSVLFALGIFFFDKSIFPLPKVFFIWLFVFCGAFAGAVYSSRYHPNWYFLPLYLTGEVLLPLFVISIFSKMKNRELVPLSIFLIIFTQISVLILYFV